MLITLDTEGLPIGSRPETYPPRPIGVAVKYGNRPSHYYAFGHKTGNNCSPADARAALGEALAVPGASFLFHNAKFDLEVIAEFFGFPFLLDPANWARFHDTSFLAFLVDPHAHSHGLKNLAERHLNWRADERDVISEYVWENRQAIQKDSGRRVNRKPGKPERGNVCASNAMEFMEYVPGDMAGAYACGDVDRTYALFQTFYGEVTRAGMSEAYDRERQLMPILLENERLGIRVDLDALARDCEMFGKVMAYVEDQLRRRLGAPDLNFDADQDYAHALIRSGVVDENRFARTEKRGDFRVGKDALTPDMFNDPRVASAVGYRNRLKTSLTMFMDKWLDQGMRRSGVVSTGWNQTRGGEGGTRTGRPSTSGEFNLLNIAKSFEDRPDGYEHPEFLGVPKLPLVRSYMLPDEGGVWCHRDFSGQELRVFAHYEAGALRQAYLENPALDPHEWVRDVMQQLVPSLLPPDSWSKERKEAFNKALRTKVKVTNFRSLYGGGVGAIQKSLGLTEQEAKEFKAFHDRALPGRRLLNDALTKAAKSGQPIRTLGGRLYYVEPSRVINGRLQDYYYKLINYLIQGSAADLTKQALIDWYWHPDRKARFLVTVYDEINISVPGELGSQNVLDQMRLLREVMCAPRLSVPMLSDGKMGLSWGALKKCE